LLAVGWLQLGGWAHTFTNRPYPNCYSFDSHVHIHDHFHAFTFGDLYTPPQLNPNIYHHTDLDAFAHLRTGWLLATAG